MKRKYSVFLGNVGSCSDRYCGSYSEQIGMEKMFERVAKIELISGIDLVATPELMRNAGVLKNRIAKHGLKVVSVAADTFSQAQWGSGSFSSCDGSFGERGGSDQSVC